MTVGSPGCSVSTSRPPLVGVVVLLAAHFFVVASGYFLLLAAMVAGAGLIMASGYRPLRAGRARPRRRRTRRRQLSDRPGGDGDRPVRDADPAPRHDAPGGARRALRLASSAPWLRRRVLRRPRSASRRSVRCRTSPGSARFCPWWLESGVVIFFIPFMSSMVSIIALTNATVLAENVGLRCASSRRTCRGIRRARAAPDRARPP